MERHRPDDPSIRQDAEQLIAAHHEHSSNRVAVQNIGYNRFRSFRFDPD